MQALRASHLLQWLLCAKEEIKKPPPSQRNMTFDELCCHRLQATALRTEYRKVLGIVFGTLYVSQKFLLTLNPIRVAGAYCALLWECAFPGAQLPGAVRGQGCCGWGEVSEGGLRSWEQHSSEERRTGRKDCRLLPIHSPLLKDQVAIFSWALNITFPGLPCRLKCPYD